MIPVCAILKQVILGYCLQIRAYSVSSVYSKPYFVHGFVICFPTTLFLSLKYWDVIYRTPSYSLFFLFLQAISRYLPRRDPVLKPLIYEMVLHEFLESDYEVLQPDMSSCGSSCKQNTLSGVEFQ